VRKIALIADLHANFPALVEDMELRQVPDREFIIKAFFRE
jgi:hypothetical protein